MDKTVTQGISNLSIIRLATVVLPEADPPQIPTTYGCFKIFPSRSYHGGRPFVYIRYNLSATIKKHFIEPTQQIRK